MIDFRCISMSKMVRRFVLKPLRRIEDNAPYRFGDESRRRDGGIAPYRIGLLALCLTAAFAGWAGNGIVDGTSIPVVDGTAKVGTLDDLQYALDDEEVSTVVVTNTIILTDGTYLSANSTVNGPRKVVQVEMPFLPEDGKVTLTKSDGSDVLDTLLTPEEEMYSTYNLFTIQSGAKVTISNLTLMGGFKGERNGNSYNATVGGIDNYGLLAMYETDITRTGTALLNRQNATSVLVDCNIVRNANWYGGGILNLGDYSESSGASNQGTVVMDRCSLTENESLGPAHGGGAAENQGFMYLNNCIVANNASTEIGGGINNCKGGELYVMNSTFTGNITTSEAYGETAGGAIGNAGGAGNVYIVNSIFAHNGYDTGEYVNPSSLGRYDGATAAHSCHLINSAIDATAGMDRLDMTNSTVKIEGLFNGYDEDGIVAAGGSNTEGGMIYSSGFSHPYVISEDPKSNPYRFSPVMAAVATNHYLVTLSVDTYFDYSGLLDGTASKPAMGYDNGEAIVALGPDVSTPTEDMIVNVTFNGDSRSPYNVMGAATVKIIEDEDTPLPPGVFKVTLGDFTGGKVSGVTVYGDSYISNSVVTVHAVPESAHYLNGWMINGEKIEDTEQQFVFSFTVTTNITITPVFQPVETRIYRARQRYPWNNLVDIDYSVAETNAVKYRLVFLATYEDGGTNCTIQLKTFRKNADVQEVQRLGDREDLHRSGDHRVTWDSAADGVDLKGKKVHYRALACEGDER